MGQERIAHQILNIPYNNIGEDNNHGCVNSKGGRMSQLP